ncbi:hypothetical protein FEM48_Zijuj11G0082200 [Ziziphus jujuba var. spinosa]|uniref:Beta-amyrin 11-oxidase-like n=1 Tax=Ziziphus jujuba var. spinosa TaxID=714518 RepID=A0A978UHT7_ZIZJJ|nr:hypothetical protein FEM48_Zijuj11G0082200 [Ziziphus jujuba var. spinosa]
MNRPIDILAELRTVVFKFITHTFIGADDNDAIVREMEILFTDLHAGLISLNINLPGFAFHRALQSRKRLVKILQAVLDKKRADANVKGKTGGKDMMDSLMALEDEDGRKLGDEDIIDLLLLFLLAGHESSVLGTLWGMIFLTDHPRVFQKAKEEQEMIIKNRPPDQKGLTFKEIKQMGYLAKVIDEMLRQTNMVFANFREAIADVNINGYFIPKGWKVFAWSRGVHMDPEIYSDPLEFNPERWDNVRPRPGASIPFGLGSRYCPGSDLAKLEISIFLHYFLLNYRLERVNPKCPVTYLTVPRPTDNCLARVIKVA